MYVIVDKATQAVLHMSNSYPGEDREPKELMPGFDPATMDFARSPSQALPPLRGEEAAAPPVAPDFRVLPPLRSGESLPRPAGGKLVPWESLPLLRDAAVAPQRRVPWRRLPPLRAGLAAVLSPAG